MLVFCHKSVEFKDICVELDDSSSKFLQTSPLKCCSWPCWSPCMLRIYDTWITVNTHFVWLLQSTCWAGLRPVPVAVRSLPGPMGHVPPLLILQTMQALNWRLTDIAKASHEDNVRVASVSVILCPLRNAPPPPSVFSLSRVFYLCDRFQVAALCCGTDTHKEGDFTELRNFADATQSSDGRCRSAHLCVCLWISRVLTANRRLPCHSACTESCWVLYPV